MADELRDALIQIRDSLSDLDGVQRAQVGQIMDALSDADVTLAVASVFLLRARATGQTFTSITEGHQMEIRLYWPLTSANSEVVELEMARMWDVLMTEFFGVDADRNLTEKATVALLGGEEGQTLYETAFERVGENLHRIMRVTIEAILDTHSV